jgi:hypothetical protein
MPAVNQLKLSIGGPETIPGTAVTRTHRIPIREPATIAEKAEKIDDPVITGKNLSAGSYPVALDVSGGIPLTPRPCGGIGKLFRSVLGGFAAPVQIGGIIRVRYTGTEASCKLVADNTGNTLTSYIGTRGAEAADTNFGTTGVIDFDSAGFDTIAEVVAAIAAYTDYDCEKIAGPNTLNLATCKVQSFTTREGKDTWCYVFFTSATSLVYDHVFQFLLTTAEHPCYSIQEDGKGDNFLYAGCVVDTLSLKGGLKQVVEGEVSILGMAETGSQTETVLELPDTDPMIFQQGGFTIGAKEFAFIRDFSLQFDGGHLKDGFGQGSLSRLYQQKGIYKASGAATLRLDEDSFALRAFTKAGGRTALSFYFTGKNLVPDIPELVIVELPYVSYDKWEPKNNNGVFDCSFDYGVRYPNGILYNNPITVHMLTKESTQY